MPAGQHHASVAAEVANRLVVRSYDGGMSFHPAPALVVNEVDRATLNAVVRAPTSEQRAVTRARIVLASADGTAISRIAHELGVTVNTVKLWRRRYERMASRVWSKRRGRTAGGLWPSRARSGHRPHS